MASPPPSSLLLPLLACNGHASHARAAINSAPTRNHPTRSGGCCNLRREPFLTCPPEPPPPSRHAPVLLPPAAGGPLLDSLFFFLLSRVL
ncbi:hypothetical protein E2562_008676 [Oryza meyeriana var. granulata]|uniref:Uncharacterized protein n=1 Tax=Oryza meyeriana var. granulata TaxID=110450 RepID=A0A6G1F5N5_9ORYZ|nr:hypothetical protein E2562_008676 [Oryza meyeriana var. granulata]